MLIISLNIAYEGENVNLNYIYTIKCTTNALKMVFRSNTQITFDVTLTSSSGNHHNHFL